MRCAFYAGSFDPPTLGHVDIIERALPLCDRLVLGVGAHPSKTPMFSPEERVTMLREIILNLNAAGRCEAILFHGLTVDAALSHGAQCMLRGLRDGGDLAYEMQLSGMNRAMMPDIETVFLASSPGVAHITSTLVRQIANLGGDVSQFVVPSVLKHIAYKSKYSQ